MLREAAAIAGRGESLACFAEPSPVALPVTLPVVSVSGISGWAGGSGIAFEWNLLLNDCSPGIRVAVAVSDMPRYDETVDEEGTDGAV
jgi:hypothetical protein